MQDQDQTIEQSEGSAAQVSDTLEAKIQAQFNEEKWTRIGPKDVSISRFRLLEDLLKEAAEENSYELLQQMSREHLDEYEASVAARYFLGMIALKKNLPDQIIFLKQLLDQFQEVSKWAVVDYLADEMLTVSENRTILRAKTTALEKLGRNKEVIPVLEKLAKIDRKNPDISLRYADAVINDDLEKGIQFYKQAAESYAKSMQFEKLKTVWNKLVDLIPEDFNFFKKIERILSGHRQKEVLADLYVQLAYHYIKKDDVDNIISISKKILDYNPNYTRFKNELIKAYRAKYADHSLLEDFLKYSGLLSNKRSVPNSIQNFETNVVFDKDNYVFHRTWGVGKIKELNTEEMIIDFKDKDAHRMEIQMALKSLKPLKEDHFWVHQFEKPDELKKMFEEDTIGFFKILLQSFGNRISLADIKIELADVFIPLKQWSKWWSKARAEILKDNLIGVSPQRKDIIELYENPITTSERIIEKFQAASNFEDRVAAAVDGLKDPEEAEDALEYMTPFFKDTLKSLDLEVRLQSMLVLDMIQASFHEDDLYYDTEVFSQMVNTIGEKNPIEIANIESKIKQVELKKQYVKFLKNHYKNWKDSYLEILTHTPIKIHKNLISDLIATESWEELETFFTKLRKEAKDNTEVFLWTLKNLLTGSFEINSIPMPEQILAYFRLLRTVEKTEKTGTKLKNMARDMLLGQPAEKLLKIVEDEAKDYVRKFTSLIRDVPFFTDPEKETVIQTLKGIHPEAFGSEDEAGDDDKIDTVHLVDELKKEGKSAASQNAIDSMRAELDHILNVEMPQNSEEIGIAQEKGDLRENAEYKAAMEKQAQLQAHVTRLDQQLKQVHLITKDQVVTDQVSLGCKVQLKDLDTEDIFIYVILDQWDADVDKGIISYKSPLGQVLIGQRKGDTAVFGLGNKDQKLEVLSIDTAIDDEGKLT